RSSSLDLTLVRKLYDRLHDLPSPTLVASRLRLAGIAFPIAEVVRAGSDPATNLDVYRGTTSALGDVEIKTRDGLTGIK
ncbi:hypothetical protein ACXWRF_09160, partial [Streptococcus pyogenes]